MVFSRVKRDFLELFPTFPLRASEKLPPSKRNNPPGRALGGYGSKGSRLAQMADDSLRCLREVLRVPILPHVAMALAYGLALGWDTSRSPSSMTPMFASLVGALVVYPLGAAMWSLLKRGGGSGK